MKKAPAPKLDQHSVSLVLSISTVILLIIIILNKLSFAQAKVSELGGLTTMDSSTETIPDNKAAGKRASLKLSPTTTLIMVDCQDPDDCEVTLDDSAGQVGDVLYVYNKAKTVPMNESSQISIYTSLYTTAGASANLYKGLTAEFIHNGTFWSPVQN